MLYYSNKVALLHQFALKPNSEGTGSLEVFCSHNCEEKKLLVPFFTSMLRVTDFNTKGVETTTLMGILEIRASQ